MTSTGTLMDYTRTVDLIVQDLLDKLNLHCIKNKACTPAQASQLETFYYSRYQEKLRRKEA